MPRVHAAAVRVVVMALVAAAVVWTVSVHAAVYVGGGSMEPALRRGDLAIVRLDDGAIRSGDIVLAEKPGWPAGVLHRVVAFTPDGQAVLRGDANPVADRDPVALPAIRGHVVLVVPSGRVLQLVENAMRVVQSHLT